ncbi:MAG: hypothetical protein KAJ58_02465 [Candidatus Pacebacteria bacterium]|nr:hypothetical protein [Candidatus Paceibacterota bacterium]
MIYLIVSILISGILVCLMLIFKGSRLKFWMNFVSSGFMQRSDDFFEKLFLLLRKYLKKLLILLLLEGTEFLFKIKRKVILLKNKIIKRTNNQIDKLYKQKIAAPNSDYLKNIEEHKNKALEDRDELRF